MTQFEVAVHENWSLAVAAAVADFPRSRPHVLAALQSQSPNVRSAAVAVLHEANDHEAHGLILPLLFDSEKSVQDEALEYLEEFAQRSDAPLLLAALKDGAHPFLATSALCRLSGRSGPLLDEEDSPDEFAAGVEAWQCALGALGLLPGQQDDA
jgi:HEAT repeat protein